MIAPRDIIPAALRGRVRDFFDPGGAFQRACEGGEFPFEIRPQQAHMADAVAHALEDRRHLVVEAGTGIGKSFAYLVPAALEGVQSRAPVVISTHTIALQEQLMAKDVPFLQRHMGVDFSAVLVKGRGNYVCRRRLARARDTQGELFTDSVEAEIEALQDWARHKAREGSIQELGRVPSDEAWAAVCCEHGNCLLQKCPALSGCFFMAARQRAREARLLIVNHHLLFSEFALRRQDVTFLPDYRVVVLDEAHMVENVASEHLGLRLSHGNFEHWLRRLYIPEHNRGLLALLRRGDLAHEVEVARQAVERLFVKAQAWAQFDEEHRVRPVPEPLDLPEELADHMRRIVEGVDALRDEQAADDVRAELAALRDRGEDMRASLTAFLRQTLPDQIYWMEREGTRRAQTVLYSAPVEVGPLLKAHLFGELDSVVMTSATLAVNGRLDYFCSRVGADEADTLCLGSPFDFARQMRLYLARDLPDPNDTERFIPAAAQAIIRFVRKSHGQAFVLFTSASMLRQMAALVRTPLGDEGYTLLVQGEGMDRHAMLNTFRRGKNSVLFGLDSFWMGVDVRGDALRNVIIVKLPFAVPDHPVVKARMDRLREQGRQPFRDYSLPEAVLKFRQGVGRLIRTATDEGTIVVLDSRLVRKPYGRFFLRSLPTCRVTHFWQDGTEEDGDTIEA